MRNLPAPAHSENASASLTTTHRTMTQKPWTVDLATSVTCHQPEVRVHTGKQRWMKIQFSITFSSSAMNILAGLLTVSGLLASLHIHLSWSDNTLSYKWWHKLVCWHVGQGCKIRILVLDKHAAGKAVLDIVHPHPCRVSASEVSCCWTRAGLEQTCQTLTRSRMTGFECHCYHIYRRPFHPQFSPRFPVRLIFGGDGRFVIHTLLLKNAATGVKFTFSIITVKCMSPDRPMRCDSGAKYRTINAVCNNLQHPLRGSANRPYERWLDPQDGDKGMRWVAFFWIGMNNLNAETGQSW